MPTNTKYTNFSDLDLINNYVQKNDNLFVGILYERYGHLVLGLSIKYLKNKDEAQDAVIQIFSNLLNDLKKHKIQYFKSWLYVYSKKLLFNGIAQTPKYAKKELELKENVHLVVDFSNPDHLNEKETQIAIMEQAIEQLNSEQKTCIELFYLKNKSYVDIEEITGFTNNEVKSYIQNGKRNLKLKMEVLINEQQAK